MNEKLLEAYLIEICCSLKIPAERVFKTCNELKKEMVKRNND